MSLHDSLIRKTLATSPRLVQFDRCQASLPLWLTEALVVTRVAEGEPAGARSATRSNRTFDRHQIADDFPFF